MIETLIDKQDNFEVIRDQIAAILVSEIANQQVLAAAKDPADWKLRVFTERTNAWEQFLGENPTDVSPLVNVWWDDSNFNARASDTFERQKSESVYNLDCYGYGKSADVPGGGHTPGDREAAFEVQKAVRLVRNILMAAEYTYLGLRGLVWARWPQSIKSFQPSFDGNPTTQIVGARIALRVDFNEFSPQVVPETLETLAATIRRAEDGEILAEAEYDYPP